jgi:hypothetical protein
MSAVRGRPGDAAGISPRHTYISLPLPSFPSSPLSLLPSSSTSPLPASGRLSPSPCTRSDQAEPPPTLAGQPPLQHAQQRLPVERHGVDELHEPPHDPRLDLAIQGGVERERGRRVDLEDPDLQIRIEDHVETEELEAVDAVRDGVLDREERHEHHLLHLRGRGPGTERHVEVEVREGEMEVCVCVRERGRERGREGEREREREAELCERAD